MARKSDRPKNSAKDGGMDLEEEDLDRVSGGPNERDHDHIGDFNVKAKHKVPANKVTSID